MSFDFYVYLEGQQQCPTTGQNGCVDLASGFVDGCAVWFSTKDKNTARRNYINSAKQMTCKLPSDLKLEAWPPSGLHANWFGLQVEFELLTPWYSKDDRVFHVLDNPVRKDRVFGVPFMSAASWKGMLRWACRMQEGLREHLEEGKKFEEWKEPDWILHLFGNEKGEERSFHQGALVFYPTWFNKIGFEVINPHSRERRAGTRPIYYEVVPGRRPKQSNPEELEEGGKGTLWLLYAPWPGMKPLADPKDFLPKLLEAIEMLLTTYGISAKRTVGWGTAKITQWQAFRKGQPTVTCTSRDDLWLQIQGWFPGGTS
ncbi:MAG: RAMP superfamily CRISPR-associated protein [Anaerolineales bacterium]